MRKSERIRLLEMELLRTQFEISFKQHRHNFVNVFVPKLNSYNIYVLVDVVGTMQ